MLIESYWYLLTLETYMAFIVFVHITIPCEQVNLLRPSDAYMRQ